MEIAPGIFLDPRRALWMEEHGTLAVADLHLGYAWAQRHAGMLLPIHTPDNTIDRLVALAEEYRPTQVVLLGDIVHRAVPLPAIRDELRLLSAKLSPTIRWIAGNHDRGLDTLLEQPIEPHLELGPHLLTHGAEECPLPAAPGWLIMGHEHPAIHLHDGVTTSVKCPCFLAGPRILILPAFSHWAAGTNIRHTPFLSPFARQATFTQAYAILANRLPPHTDLGQFKMTSSRFAKMSAPACLGRA